MSLADRYTSVQARSCQAVYDEVFVDHEYEVDLDDLKFIIDAGAHIGLSSVYFASKYPDATIVAVEPEPLNYKMLCRNAKKWKNIKPIQAGLWSHKARLKIDDSDVESWGFTISENRTGKGIPALGVQDILQLFDQTHVDVLKIGIEGSEVGVLEASKQWMDKVSTLVIELHDRFKTGCTAALDVALTG
tara:strand:- start:1238 stop:1804 length:567 start_codon:yes stop_codon:yes gene_type:complete